MTTFPAYADNFELYPTDREAARHLAPLFSGLGRIDFSFSVDDPKVNQGQMACRCMKTRRCSRSSIDMPHAYTEDQLVEQPAIRWGKAEG
jgi:hypothetical protein